MQSAARKDNKGTEWSTQQGGEIVGIPQEKITT